jgi:hypothetical protein
MSMMMMIVRYICEMERMWLSTSSPRVALCLLVLTRTKVAAGDGGIDSQLATT